MYGKPHAKAHSRTRHTRLRGPDWYVSALMLDRSLDAISSRLVLDRNFHVPYLAGYSTDGRTIYIDRDLPPSFTAKAGGTVQVDRYLLLHEAVEKALIDAFDLRYQHAHQIALRSEEAAVRADGIQWREYDRFMQASIKELVEQRPLHLPPDLDLKPYVDEHDKDLLVLMKKWMKAYRDPKHHAAVAEASLAASKPSRLPRRHR